MTDDEVVGVPREHIAHQLPIQHDNASPILFHQDQLSLLTSLVQDTERLPEPKLSTFPPVIPMTLLSGRMELLMSKSGQPVMSEHQLLFHMRAPQE